MVTANKFTDANTQREFDRVYKTISKIETLLEELKAKLETLSSTVQSIQSGGING